MQFCDLWNNRGRLLHKDIRRIPAFLIHQLFEGAAEEQVDRNWDFRSLEIMPCQLRLALVSTNVRIGITRMAGEIVCWRAIDGASVGRRAARQ